MVIVPPRIAAIVDFTLGDHLLEDYSTVHDRRRLSAVSCLLVCHLSSPAVCGSPEHSRAPASEWPSSSTVDMARDLTAVMTQEVVLDSRRFIATAAKHSRCHRGKRLPLRAIEANANMLGGRFCENPEDVAVEVKMVLIR